MNKVHRIVWNCSLGQWVVAAETARAHTTGKKGKALVGAVLLTVAAGAQAVCSPDTGGILNASAGDNCTAAQPAYSGARGAGGILHGDGAGAVIQVTGADVTVTNTSGANAAYALRVGNGAVINADGNLTAVTNGFNGRGLMIFTGGFVNVSGNLTALHQGAQAAAIEVQYGGNLTVNGTTAIKTNNADGMRVIGTATFEGDVDIEAGNYPFGGVLSDGTSNFNSNLIIKTANMFGMHVRAGQVNVAKNVSIATTGNDAHGITVSAGSGKVFITGDTTVTTTGDNAIGIRAASANTLVEGLGTNNSITTSGAGSHGLYANALGASVAVGASAVAGTGPSVYLAAGSVTTSGNDAEGIYALSNASNVIITATQSGGSITTSGIEADGVVALANGDTTTTGVQAIATQSGGSIVTTGGATTVPILGTPVNGSSGLVAQVGTVSALGVPSGGTGEAQAIQSGGSIQTSGIIGFGIVAMNAGTGDAIVTQTGGTVATTGELGQGIYASAETGSAVVDSVGAVTTSGQSAAGILALGSEGVRINQTGSITTTGVGQSSHMPTIMALLGYAAVDTGNSDGILAFAEGDITINAANINAAGDGIDANAMGGGNVNITTSGSIQAGEEGIDAYSESGNIVISNGASTTTSGTSILAVADTGTAQITNTGSITSSGGDGINVEAVAGGATIINSGNIIATSAGHYAIRGSAANDSVITTAGTIRGDISLDSGNDTFVASGGSINGSVFMGSGNDNAVLGGSFDPAGLSQIDGGAGTDTLGISGLSLSGYTDSGAGGVNLTGWETINVEDGGTLKLTGDLFEAGPAGMRQLNIDASSTLDLTGNSPGIFTIHGSVSNAGTLTFADGAGDDQTTVAGNYAGASGSTILFDTVFNDDASATDRLVVNGDVSGASVLTVNNIGGSGAQTTHGIKLIQVDGSSGSSNFSWDIGNLQVGNYQYVLQQGSAVDANDWYLVSAVVPCEQSGTCSSNGNPNAPVVYAPGNPQPLWRPAVSAYSVARSMNADIGFMQTATLHQRQGDLNVQSAEEGKAWGRFLAQDLTGKGRDRFSYDQESQGFQLGHDLSNRTDEAGTRTRMGWLGHYVNSKTDAWDHVRPTAGLQADTGRISTESYGVGGYRTDIKGDGSYIDWVGHLNQIKNDFSDSYGERAKQKGWQVALAVEKGMPLTSFEAASNQWTVEGQGQAVLLHTRYGAFEDNYSRMKGESFDALRARVGIRVHNGQGRVDGAEAQKTQYYGIVHLVHDLIKTREMTLSAKGANQQVKAGETFDQTYLEVGAGVQTQMGEASWLWADARFEAGLKNRKDTGKLSFGFRKSF